MQLHLLFVLPTKDKKTPPAGVGVARAFGECQRRNDLHRGKVCCSSSDAPTRALQYVWKVKQRAWELISPQKTEELSRESIWKPSLALILMCIPKTAMRQCHSRKSNVQLTVV